MKKIEKNIEEFKPFIIEDKELLEIISRIHKEKEGITKLMLDMIHARGEIEDKKHKWFLKVIKKYNIPKEHEDELTYNHGTHKITL